MATIDSLNKSISDMSDDELQNRMLDLRKARRVVKMPKTSKKKDPKKSGNPAMSDEDTLKLIKMLEEM